VKLFIEVTEEEAERAYYAGARQGRCKGRVSREGYFVYKQIRTVCWCAAVFKIALMPLKDKIFTCFCKIAKDL
jgi:hypothetical protein